MDNYRSDALPQNWAYIDIGTCYQVVGGGTPSTSVKEYWGGETPWITSADIGGVRDIHITRHVTQKGIQESATNMVPDRSLLVATRVGLGKIAITDKPICFSQDLQGLVQRPDIILPEYGLFFLSFQLQRLKFEGRGTTISGITKKQLKDTELPLPPYQEQRRIVAKIEELFSELDKGIESLKAARAKLNVYRQAVLKHAFEGKLTAQWREENKDKLESPEKMLARIKQEREAYHEQQLQKWKDAVRKWEEGGKSGKKPAKPRKLKKLQPFDLEELAKLPELESASWKWVKIDEICSHTQYSIKAGPFGSALKKQYYVPVGYKVYGQEQVISSDPHYGDYYIDSSKFEELKTCKIAPKDVLISLVGTVGKVLVLPDNCREGVINPRLVKISLNLDYYRPKFFKYFFESAFVKSLYKTLAKGTTMDVLNLGIIQKLPFPLCSIAEQDKLVSEIDSKLSVVDQIEKETEAGLKKSKALRKSILRKAFSGQLLAQDPKDEPASILLERIRAEKTAQSKINTRAKRRRKAATT